MSVKIKDVEKGSICYKKISGGETLISVNSHEINDVLDYRFFLPDTKLTLDICGDIAGRCICCVPPCSIGYADKCGIEFLQFGKGTVHGFYGACLFRWEHLK